jgi:hypothetical protein
MYTYRIVYIKDGKKIKHYGEEETIQKIIAEYEGCEILELDLTEVTDGNK